MMSAKVFANEVTRIIGVALDEPQQVISGASQSKGLSKLLPSSQANDAANVLGRAEVTAPGKGEPTIRRLLSYHCGRSLPDPILGVPEEVDYVPNVEGAGCHSGALQQGPPQSLVTLTTEESRLGGASKGVFTIPCLVVGEDMFFLLGIAPS